MIFLNFNFSKIMLLLQNIKQYSETYYSTILKYSTWNLLIIKIIDFIETDKLV